MVIARWFAGWRRRQAVSNKRVNAIRPRPVIALPAKSKNVFPFLLCYMANMQAYFVVLHSALLCPVL